MLPVLLGKAESLLLGLEKRYSQLLRYPVS